MIANETTIALRSHIGQQTAFSNEKTRYRMVGYKKTRDEKYEKIQLKKLRTFTKGKLKL